MALHTQNRIPSYNLYGEMGDFPDVVHCEAISTRSVLHNWNIKPHRHSRLHQFFFVESGGGEYNIDGRKGTLEPPQILNIPARSVHGFTFIAGTKGWVVTVPLEYLNQNIASSLRQNINTPHMARPEPALIALFDEIAREHAERRFARAHILQALTALIAGRLIRMIAEQGQSEDTKTGSPLVGRFETLMEQHFCDHWTINQYARALAVSTTHLTRVTKQYTGLPASKLIEGRLIQEARRDLAYTSLTISETAYRIGYSDPAYFTRVFTRATGMTPTAFRAGLEEI